MKRILILVITLCVLPYIAQAQLSMREYIVEVVEYNNALAAARSAMDGADADLQLARKGYLPALSASADADYGFRRIDERDVGWGVRADISQRLYGGGSVRVGVERARKMTEIAEERERGAMLGAEYEAATAYWALSRAEIYSQAMASYRDIVLSLRDVVARRFDEGYTSKSDLLQVESRLSDAEYQLSSAEQQRLVALHNLNVLRGMNPALDVELKESILDTMYMPHREDIEDILVRHPDYVASLAKSDYARLGVRATQAEYLPSVNLGIYGLWQPNVPNIRDAGTRLDGGAVIRLQAPIFHFGERRESVRSARSAQRVAEFESNDVADRISLDESNGWTNLLATHARIEATRRNLALARENLEISTYSYREGMATILDVLQAQLSWLQIYENAIAAHYDYALAIAAYRYITAQ